MQKFWQEKTLEQMTDEEWESLCDGCARCCLLKLEDEDTNELYYTNVSCHLLNIEKCQCGDYQNRLFRVPECLNIRDMKKTDFQWLPETCAYRLIAADKVLPAWHPLVSHSYQSVQMSGMSIHGFAQSELHIHPDELPDHIIILTDGQYENS